MLEPEFFAGVERRLRPLPLSDGSSVEFPLRSYAGVMMALSLTVAYDAAAALPPARHFVPVRLTRRRALLVLIAVEYTRKCIGPYREVLAALPILRGARWNPPLVPALLKDRWPGFGLYLTHIGVTTERARIVGWEILGFPKILVDIVFSEDGRRRTCAVMEDRTPILSFSVATPAARRLRRSEMHVYSLSPADNLIHHVVYESQMAVGGAFGRAAGSLNLGSDHAMAAELRGLAPGVAVQARYASSFQLISHPPVEKLAVGGWRDPRHVYRRVDTVANTERA